MSDYESAPTPDADRTVTDEDDLDPEAPTDSTAVNPPREDADRPVPELDDVADDFPGDFQEENAATSLDQPSDGSS